MDNLTDRDDISIRADIEAAVQRAIKDMHLKTRTAKSEARARRIALDVVRNAWATVIADDVAQGDKPWSDTVARYAALVHLIEG